MQVKVKKLNEKASLPVYSSKSAAGADLCALLDEPIVIASGETVFIKTGIALEIPEGYGGLIYARSGLACKRSVAPANKVGVIDSDYRGEIMVALFNHGKDAQTIEPGERVAQLVITPYLTAEFSEAEDITETKRASGGFGSTGRK